MRTIDISSGFESVVTINVGIKPGRKIFMLHEHTLRNSSLYFASMIDAQCGVGDQSKPIALPCIKIEDFAVYAKFLYTGLFFTKDISSTELTWCLSLLKCAKYLQATDFHDAIVDALIEIVLDFRVLKGSCRFTAAQITTIYSTTEEDSPLRKFAQNLCLQSKGPQGFDKRRMKDFPIEFQLDLLTAAAPYITSSAKSTDMEDPLDLSRSCKYHQHTLHGKPCYKAKYQFLTEEAVAGAKPLPDSAGGGRRQQSEQQTERFASNDFELRV